MGFPFEHGFHSTLIAMRLGDRLGVDPETASQTYYACLLTYAGCTWPIEGSVGETGVATRRAAGADLVNRRMAA